MSVTILPEAPADRVRLGLAVQARCAVIVAHGLTFLPPQMLERAMRLVVHSGRRPSSDAVVGYREAVVSVSSVCAGHGCLPRSIATALLARLHGRGVSWFTGIRDAPFRAHAWVSIDDRPVGEAPEVRSFSTVLFAVPSYTHSPSATGEQARR